MKKLNKKTKTTADVLAAVLLVGKLVQMHRDIMQRAMPVPETMNNMRRPKRSTVKKATKHDRNFHVKVPPDSMRAV